MSIPNSDRPERRLLALCMAFLPIFAAAQVQAQTCANPIPLVDGQTHDFNTCFAPNSLPFLGGFYESPQNDVVYRFHTDGVPSGSFYFDSPPWEPWDLYGVIVSDCSPDAPAKGEFEMNYSGSVFPLPTLPAGDNFLIVSGNPFSAPNTCGAYRVTAHISEPAVPGSCAAPIEYTSGTRAQGNTCTATNTLPIIDGGGMPSPQNDLAYRIKPESLINRQITINAGDFETTAFLLPSCSTSAFASAAIQISPGGSGVLTVPSNLTADQYLVITSDPGGPSNGCGQFDFTDVVPGIVTDPAAFVAALQPGYYVEPFSQPPRGATEHLIKLSKNGYVYGIVPTGSNAKLRYEKDSHGTPNSLSIVASSVTRSMRIRFAGLPVNAIGGMFGFKESLLQSQGTITVSIRSGNKIKSYTIRGGSGFTGFGGRDRIDEVVIGASSSLSAALMMDNLIVGWANSP